MKTIFYLFFFSFSFAFTLRAQDKIIFPNNSENAGVHELKYCYLEGFPIEIIGGKKVLSIWSSNGAVHIDKSKKDIKYYCNPKKMGICIIYATLQMGSDIIKITNEITVIPKPKIEFKVTRISVDSNLIHYKFIDKSTGSEIQHGYSGSIFLSLYKQSKSTGILIKELNGLINLNDQKFKAKLIDFNRIKIETNLKDDKADLQVLNSSEWFELRK